MVTFQAICFIHCSVGWAVIPAISTCGSSTVVQEIATATQDAPSIHGHFAGDLLHPWLARMGSDAGDIHAAALEMNEERHVVGHQPSQRENLDSEEVRCREQREVGPNEFRPAGRTFAFRRRR